SSIDTISGMKNCTWYYALTGTQDWNLIGSDTNALDGLNYSWFVPVDDVYDVNATCFDNVGFSADNVSTSIIVDAVDDFAPVCNVIYPNATGIFVSGDVIVNATVSDLDPSDVIENVTFNYSDDGGDTWFGIGVNLTSGLSNYSYLWDTTGLDGNQFLVNCSAVDSRGLSGIDTSDNNFTVDNTLPVILGEAINSTSIGIHEGICVNVTITDAVGIDTVKAEIDIPSVGSNENITLLDDGLGCDSSSSDDVYSVVYVSSYGGQYNWTKTYATDIAGNINFTNTGLTWDVTAAAASITLIGPVSDYAINESGFNNAYEHECNVTCDSFGDDCNDVIFYAQYYIAGAWYDITTETTDLVNDEDSKAAQSPLYNGTSENYTFNITSGVNSGGNSWPIRCKATASNAGDADSNNVTLSVNDPPSVSFLYPSFNGEWVSGMIDLNCSASDIDGTIDYTDFYNSTDGGSYDLIAGCLGVSGDNPICNYDTQTSVCAQGDACYFRCVSYDDMGANTTANRTAKIDNIGPVSTLDYARNYENITSSSFILNATVVDSYVGIISDVIFEYRENDTASWEIACVDSNYDAYYNCSWDTMIGVQSDTYFVRVRANDTLGNMGDYGASHTNITVDLTEPYVLLNTPSNNTYFDMQDITFTFTPQDNVAETLNCSLYIDDVLNDTNATSVNNTMTSFDVFGIIEGNHNWSVSCFDEVGLQNSSLVNNFVVDLTKPSVVLNVPENNTNITSGTVLDFSITDDNLNTSWWSNNSGVDNYTFTAPFDVDTTGWLDGTVYVNVWANDSSGNVNVSLFLFVIDDTPPIITINSPLNITYNTTSIDLDVEFGEIINVSWYSLNGGLNQTLCSGLSSCNTGITALSGVNNITVYANDSLNNVNSSIVYFTVDIESPQWSLQKQTVVGVDTTTVYRNQTIELSAYFIDNFELNTSFIETNESGVWENKTANYTSPKSLVGSASWANFSWSNSSTIPGTVVS
ncbi:hypothetical protein GQ473_04000, partial [archaeon]|nr:hypothetical protein [archaeon]